MVDSTQGSGGIRPPQNIQSINKTSSSKEEDKRTEEARSSNPQDEVEISQEALSLSQAEQTTSDVRTELERDTERSLGLDPGFDEAV